MRLIFRLLVAVLGLVFLASLLAAGVLLLLVWLLKAAWARLTGRPCASWNSALLGVSTTQSPSSK